MVVSWAFRLKAEYSQDNQNEGDSFPEGLGRPQEADNSLNYLLQKSQHWEKGNRMKEPEKLEGYDEMSVAQETHQEAVADSRPNLLLLFPDQWRYDWDGFPTLPTGEIPLHMPVTKSLAERGVRFTQAYVPSPVCTPSRGALASGREYDHNPITKVMQDYKISTSNPTFYSLLRDAGYHTMTVGKDDLQKKSGLGFYTRYPGCDDCLDGDGRYMSKELGFSDSLRYTGKDAVIQNKFPYDMYGFFLRNQSVSSENGTQTNGWLAHLACFGTGKKKTLGLCVRQPDVQERVL